MIDPTAAAAMDPSAGSSAASSTSDFTGDPGPGFDPQTAAAAIPDPEAPAGDWAALQVEEEKIREVLGMVGGGLHMLAGVGESDWAMTQSDLDRIAPPATRIINRYPALAAAVERSDELAVIFGMGLWGWRSLLERQAVLEHQALRDHAAAQPPGAPAPAAPAPAAPAGDFFATGVDVARGYVTAAERLAAQPAAGAPGEPQA